MSVYVILNKEIGKSGQEMIYTETLKHDATGTKVRVSVCSDSYRFQCHAHADVWSAKDLKWNRAVSIHHSKMATKDSLAYVSQVPVTARDFQVDRDNLLKQLTDILS